MHESVVEELVSELKRAICAFYPDGPKSSENFGRIINQAAHQRLAGYLAGDQDHIVHGGEALEDELYIAPTVLLFHGGLAAFAASAVMQDEVFGPLIPLCTYRDLGDAVAFVNGRPKPLALYCFTGDDGVAETIVNGTSSGAAMVNDVLVHQTNPWLPFGGVGGSGMGAYHGKHTFDVFTHSKAVVRGMTSLDIPMRYPPLTATKRWFIKTTLNLDYSWIWNLAAELTDKRNLLLAGAAAYLIKSRL